MKKLLALLKYYYEPHYDTFVIIALLIVNINKNKLFPKIKTKINAINIWIGESINLLT